MPFRRSYERLSFNFPAQVSLGPQVEKEITVKDLSSRGVSVLADFPFDAEQKVSLRMDKPPFAVPLVRLARVAWCRRLKNQSWQAGLDFGQDNLVDLPPLPLKARRKIFRFF